MAAIEPFKFFVIAGEPSGDLHGGKLIKAIKSINHFSTFMGHGGDSMEGEGMKIIEHTDNLAIMGFKEVVVHLPKMFKIMKKTISLIKRSKPDRVILIDYPGFNLRLAKNIANLGIPITYFILPQAWAWKSGRVKLMKKVIDQSFSIFPFEKKWYCDKGLPVKFFGHPFIENEHMNETTKQFFKKHNLNPLNPILVLLPGSREQEIKRHWILYLKTVDLIKIKLPKIQILVANSNNLVIPNMPADFKIVKNPKKAIIVASVALVASGTATLECAVENTPLVVCYKLSFLSWLIAKFLTNIKYSSIVNLIADKNIVPEFLQSNMKPEMMAKELIDLLDLQSNKRSIMLNGLNEVKNKLGTPGVYSRTAESIIKETIK